MHLDSNKQEKSCSEEQGMKGDLLYRLIFVTSLFSLSILIRKTVRQKEQGCLSGTNAVHLPLAVLVSLVVDAKKRWETQSKTFFLSAVVLSFPMNDEEINFSCCFGNKKQRKERKRGVSVCSFLIDLKKKKSICGDDCFLIKTNVTLEIDDHPE